MKIYVLTKRSLIIAAAVIVALVVLLIVLLSSNDSAQTMAPSLRDSESVSPQEQSAAAPAPAPPIVNVVRTDNKIALTFDTELTNDQTSSILKTLKNEKITATFFMSGAWVEKNKTQAKKIAQAGYEIGNLGEHDMALVDLSALQVENEISLAAKNIEKVTGVKPTLFRPPEEVYDDTLIRTANNMGYTVVMFTPNIAENSGDDTTVPTVPIKGGDIIIRYTNESNIKNLGALIKDLKDRGFEFTTLTDLIDTAQTGQ